MPRNRTASGLIEIDEIESELFDKFNMLYTYRHWGYELAYNKFPSDTCRTLLNTLKNAPKKEIKVALAIAGKAYAENIKGKSWRMW